MELFFKKIIVYGIEWLVQIYLKYSLRVKIANYSNIAVFGENFCRVTYNQLFSRDLSIHNNGQRENIQIGNNVILACKINCNTDGHIRIGNYTSIRERSVVNCDNRIDIGNYCFIGDNVLIQDNDSHPISPQIRKRQSKGLCERITDTYEAENAPIVIADGVWIGTGAVVLKGVTIGENSIIGAGSVVTRDVPAMHIAAGNPVKIIRSIAEEVK